MPRTTVAGLALLATAVLVGCRGQLLWAGAAFDNGALRLVAEQPFCGCLTLKNETQQPLLLRSDMNGRIRGAALLNPGETRQFRFDWGGGSPEDVYWIRATDSSRNELDLETVVVMDATATSCEATTCIYDTLLMNITTEEH